jgi:hypothetical protein
MYYPAGAAAQLSRTLRLPWPGRALAAWRLARCLLQPRPLGQAGEMARAIRPCRTSYASGHRDQTSSSDCSESPVAAGRIEPEVMKLPLACSIMILVEHTSSATGSGLVHARATGRGSCPKTAAAAVVRSV